ncbi:MAG: SpoIID/LytB domain-containing protein [Micrococcales bacterium]|nr:SpoIID/LytB domain-containing protein [Micrococcales bacterium]
MRMHRLVPAALITGFVVAVVPAPSQATDQTVLSLVAPTRATPGTKATLRAHWAYGSVPVTGKADLQVRDNGTWKRVRSLAISRGVARTTVTLAKSRTYRLQATSITSPTEAALTSSIKRVIRVSSSVAKSSPPDLKVSKSFTTAGSTVTLRATWRSQGRPVIGRVAFQWLNGGRWRPLTEATTVKGVARIAVTVAGNTRFRAVGRASVSHGKRLRYGATFSASPIVLVAARVEPSAPPSPTAPPMAGTQVVFTGSGWGHGVGMSQYGARAMAIAGHTASDILTHYFTGTHLATASTSEAIRVQILSKAGSTTLTFAGGGTVSVTNQGSITVPTGGKVSLTATSSGVAARLEGRSTRVPGGTKATVTWSSTLKVAGAHGVYKRGSIVASVIDGKLNLILKVAMDPDYLYGIAEVPSSWEPGALQAQAIAARTYAFMARESGVKASCDCHLFDDTRSQYYAGWTKENEAIYGKNWVAAVNATKDHLLVDANDNPVTTFYYSSSGGRTENSEDVWSSALPHLKAVDDPWSLDPASGNPNAKWTATLKAADVAKAFGLPDVASVKIASRTAGGNAAKLTATSSDGRTASISRAEKIRAAFGLKSAHLSSVKVK